jgi:DNA-binding response OmpR family regulator
LSTLIRKELDIPYTYIIVLTSLSGKGSYLEAMDAGADDFLTKPVDMDELTARLRVAERVLALQTEVDLMQKLLPVCMYCKRIRDKDAPWEEDSSWTDLESYVAETTEVQFSHGICKECYERQMEGSEGGA